MFYRLPCAGDPQLADGWMWNLAEEAPEAHLILGGGPILEALER